MTKIYFLFPKFGYGFNLKKVYIGQTFDVLEEQEENLIQYLEYSNEDLTENYNFNKKLFICSEIKLNNFDTIVKYSHDPEIIINHAKKMISETGKTFTIHCFEFDETTKSYSKIVHKLYSKLLVYQDQSLIYFYEKLNDVTKIYQEPGTNSEQFVELTEKINNLEKEIENNKLSDKLQFKKDLEDNLNTLFDKMKKNLLTCIIDDHDFSYNSPKNEKIESTYEYYDNLIQLLENKKQNKSYTTMVYIFEKISDIILQFEN